jgi:hypothetical protein
VVTPASALLALQRTHGNAAVSRAILQRKFTVTTPNIGRLNPLVGDIEYTSSLPRNYRAELVMNYGADKIDRLEAWARSSRDLGDGQPFATWEDAIKASEARGAPPDASTAPATPTATPTSGAAVTVPHTPSIPSPRQSAPSSGSGGVPSVQVPLSGPAAVLAKHLPATHVCALAATDAVEVVAEMFMLNHEVMGVPAFFAEMAPRDFNNLLIWSRDPEPNFRLLNGLASSAAYRIRIETNLSQALERLRELVGEALGQPPFAQMTLADGIRLFDIVNGAQYTGVLKIPRLPQIAAGLALDPPPATVHEFVARWSFFMQASDQLGLIIENRGDSPAEPDSEEKEPKASGYKLSGGAAGTMRGFMDTITAGVSRAGIVKPCVLRLERPLDAGNIDQLAGLIRAAAKEQSIGFGAPESALDHVLKHVRRRTDVKTQDVGALAVMAKEYLMEACQAIVEGEIATSTLSQDGRIRSFKFRSSHGHVVVIVAQDGSVRIATYVAPDRL